MRACCTPLAVHVPGFYKSAGVLTTRTIALRPVTKFSGLGGGGIDGWAAVATG